jgi:hypothetical protein
MMKEHIKVFELNTGPLAAAERRLGHFENAKQTVEDLKSSEASPESIAEAEARVTLLADAPEAVAAARAKVKQVTYTTKTFDAETGLLLLC